MKRKIISTIFISLAVLFAIAVTCNAASLTVTPSKTTVDAGETFTVTVTLNNGAGNIATSVSNGTGSKTEFLDKSSYEVSVTAGTSGTVTITASGTAADYTTEEDEQVSKSATVTIKEKEQETSGESGNAGNNENTGSNENQGGNTETTTEPEEQETPTAKEEPNFESASKTMYVKGDLVNLRKDWSTSDGSVQVKKGTELNIVATSDNKVKGYTWYKVNYQGSIRYVAAELLTSEKPVEEEKSDNANLKSLTIEGYETKPAFKASTLSYTLEVANDVNELTLDAEAEDSKASVTVEGNKDFKDGENKVKIIVTAEDGTEKVYELSVSKAKGVVLGLKVLKIKDTDMDKTFKSDVFTYKVNVKYVDKLEIEAIPTIDTATVEILGNENLQDGENTITIIVKSEDGKETKTYQITANKNVAVATDENKNNGNFQLDGRVYLYGGICLLALILLIILIVVLIRNKAKNKNDDDPDDGDLYDYDKHSDKYDKFNNEFSNDFNQTSTGAAYGLSKEESEEKDDFGPIEEEKEEEQVEEKPETYYKEDQYSPEEDESYETINKDYNDTGLSDEEYQESIIEKNEIDEPNQEELENDIEKQFGNLYNDDFGDDDKKPRRRGKHF